MTHLSFFILCKYLPHITICVETKAKWIHLADFGGTKGLGSFDNYTPSDKQTCSTRTHTPIYVLVHVPALMTQWVGKAKLPVLYN